MLFSNFNLPIGLSKTIQIEYFLLLPLVLYPKFQKPFQYYLSNEH